ncbi:MAG: helix-turn-helix domain-containing protein [Candidatus Bathyarchaeia archaeon]
MSFILLAAAISFGLEYYKQVVKIKREYEKARTAFNDMILSYSRELKRIVNDIEKIVFKVEASSTRSEEALNKAKEIEDKLKALENKINEQLESLSKVISQTNDLERQISDITVSHKELLSKVSNLEEKLERTLVTQEPRIEAVIPIKREKALAHLTETELAVLEMLATEGPKTAPEIKDRIKLSREHTARLMKKLYEEGYLERDSSKTPFKYSVKKEMEKLLKKAETEVP